MTHRPQQLSMHAPHRQAVQGLTRIDTVLQTKHHVNLIAASGICVATGLFAILLMLHAHLAIMSSRRGTGCVWFFLLQESICKHDRSS